MSGDKIGSILKVNIPEFMQGLEHLDEFLDVSGEVFDDIRSGIDDLRYIKRHDKCQDGMVDINLHELGFVLPVNIELSVKRQVLRDLANIHLRGATEDGIKHLLRVIGIEPTMNKGWLPNPKMVRNGWYRDYFTRDEYRYYPDERVRMDFLYGDTVDTDNGTFFEGYSYWDIDQEEKTKLLPISGEVYTTAGSNGVDNVEATPYLIVRFKDDSIFRVDDVESVDPDTGQVFLYSVNERFILLEEIIRFFLLGDNRSTTMRIIVEGNVLSLNDDMSVAEQFKFQLKDTSPLKNKDTVAVNEEYENDSTVDVEVSEVGDNRIFVGTPMPLYSRWWATTLTVGAPITKRAVLEAWDTLETTHHIDTLTPVVKIPLLGECNIDTHLLPPHKVVGIYDNGVREEITENGRIGIDYRWVEVSLNSPPIGKHAFIIKRIERNAA